MIRIIMSLPLPARVAVFDPLGARDLFFVSPLVVPNKDTVLAARVLEATSKWAPVASASAYLLANSQMPFLLFSSHVMKQS
jgi:hypothetical protein